MFLTVYLYYQTCINRIKLSQTIESRAQVVFMNYSGGIYPSMIQITGHEINCCPSSFLVHRPRDEGEDCACARS